MKSTEICRVMYRSLCDTFNSEIIYDYDDLPEWHVSALNVLFINTISLYQYQYEYNL